MVPLTDIGVQCMFKALMDAVNLSTTLFHWLTLAFKAWVVDVILSETWFHWVTLVFKA